jgi:hypothetical protein
VICIGAADGVLVPASPGDGDIQVRVLAYRIRRGTTLSRHLLAQIDALDLPAGHCVRECRLWLPIRSVSEVSIWQPTQCALIH